MCGIVGHTYRNPVLLQPLSAETLSRLTHRGPDGSGVYTNAHIQFGHTRLSIIDLTDAGCQPMVSLDGRHVLTYNGEIYNHLELRAELEAMGEQFLSHSDTEVLLVAYKVWGQDCIKRFRGMFAFALWDNADKTLFLARDRCGEKPLFYHRDGERLTFASELKALVPLLGTRPALDPAAVDMYLHYQYVPEPFTLLAGVHKLPAAHTLFLSAENWLAEPQRYWNVEDIADTGPLPTDTPGTLACIRDRLEDAVKVTLRADVPVAVALSGGIDSGAIAALAQKYYPEPMHAFCVGYPGRPPYDERHQARALAESLGMIVHEVELPVERFVDFFPELVRIMDEPIADPAAFGHYSVPKAAAEHGIKVLLTGIGGDEVFWGYPWVTQSVCANEILHSNPSLRMLTTWARRTSAQHFLGKIRQYPRTPRTAQRWAGLLQDLNDTNTPSRQLRFYMAATDFGDAFRLKNSLYGHAMAGLDTDNPFQPTEIGERSFEQIPAATIRMLFETWLASNALSLGDRVSMGVGVESRLPFLDVQLIETVMALRARTPDHHLGQKAWLRAALKGILPDEVVIRPKAGFQPPVHEWLTGVITAYGEILYDGELAAEGILDHGKIEAALSDLPKQGWPGLFFVYKLVLLEMWYRKIVMA
ncbi:MAG: asparagine synthase (glutamine-hydrolyzing) [Thiobacillus sp. 65-69]|nr:asparagine synthase (glutamine-hydrolyzing) [Thiobacillus sp.]ODU90893.1 MAG: asparagine synthase (glutamine-hydrolyzing) [Thiobacillus sp. SCN 65-179]OJW35681.1 MAG: asparagine synthase (glutamine-hydrolyzing) [Thiobacillus sp. 65-69]